MGGFFSPGDPKAAIPNDLQGMRRGNIDLIQQLLGFPGGPSLDQPTRGALGRLGVPSGPGASTQFGGNPLDRLQAYFGQLGVPQTDLQRQAGQGMSQFLSQPAPEQRALDVAMPGLQEILNGGGPQFERDLSLANQQGGRFGSANAILRGEAFKNMFNARDQAAQTLGMLSSNAGQNPFSRLMGAGQFGTQMAQQGDVQTQRMLQILMNLLGVSQQASFNVPTTQSPSPFSQLAGAASGILPFLGGLGGGSGKDTTGQVK